MRLRCRRWFYWRALAIGSAVLVGVSALPEAARAQFFGNFFQQPWRRPAPPQSRGYGYFQYPYFERQPHNAPPADFSKAPPPRKQETQPASTVVVIGDSLADWLAYGLEEVYADSSEIGVVRKIRSNSGLVRYEPRSDTPEWSQAIKDILATEKPSAIVVMLGLNDRLPLRDRAPQRPGAPRDGEQPAQAGQAGQGAGEAPGDQNAGGAPRPTPGGTYEYRSDKWEELYTKRIDDMIAALKAKGVPVLWVGLPSIRGTRSTGDMSYLDELYRARAEKAGIVYVDIWDGFVDESGRFAVEGPDFEGQIRRLRSGDGVFFTKVGAIKLAHYVDRELTRVLSNHVTPVALPGPEAPAPAKPGATRPVVGPVVPLTDNAGGEGGDLLGGNGHPTPPPSDSVAARVLGRGDPIPPAPGRADDFAWPRPAAGANDTEMPPPPSPAPPPPASAAPSAVTPASPAPPTKKGAGDNDRKKSEGARNEPRTRAVTD